MVSLPEPQKPAETLQGPSGPGGDPAWKPRSTLLGTLLANRYRITAALGQGSTGAVFRADDVLLKRPVAIRILVPRLAQHAPLITEIRARIEKNTERDPEALVNLVDITDVGMTLEGEVFIVTDFLDGDHLSTMLTRGGRLPWTRARSLLIRLGQILHGFHRQGIVVGTLEARHCFAVRAKAKQEAIKIVHNAILEHLAGAIGPTGGHGVAMLARYVAPERICGEPLDARTDVYSLGIIAYELLTGQLPFNDPNPIRLVSMHLQKAPPSPRSVAPDANIPPEIEALLLKCLAKDPAERFPTMEALTDALTAISETADVPAIATTPVAASAIPAPPVAASAIPASPVAAPPIPTPALSAVPSAHSVPVAAPRIPSTPISVRPSSSSSAVPAAPSPPVASGPSVLAMASRPATAPVLGGSITESGKLRLPPPPTLGGPRGTSGPLPASPTLGATPPSLGLPPPPSLPSAPAPTPIVRAPSIPVPSATLPAGTVAAPVGLPRPSSAVPSATLPAGAIPAPTATLPATSAAPVPSTSPLAAIPPASPLASPVHTTSPFTAASALAAVPSTSPIAPAPSASPLAAASTSPLAGPVPSTSSPAPAAVVPASAAPVPSAILATADMNAGAVEEDPARLRARIAAFAADEARRKNPLRAVPASAMAETRIGPAPTRPPTPIVDDEPPAPTPIAKPVVATPIAKPVVATPAARPVEAPRLQVVPQHPPEPALTPAASLSDGTLDEPPRRRGWLVGGIVGAVMAAGIAALVLTSPSFMAERTRETPTKIAAPIGAIPERAVVTPTKIAESDPPALPERGTSVVAPETPDTKSAEPADTKPVEPTPDTKSAEPTPDTKSAEPTPDSKTAAVDPPKKTKKKARRNYDFEEEEPREKDVFDQLREHMAAKKAAEEARAAAMAGNAPPAAPTPAPTPAAPPEKSEADKTLDRARVASSNGNHTLAYSLAKQAYAQGKSPDALELMGVSACRSKNADGARSAVGSLTGTRRNAVMIACTQSGITL